MSAPCAPGGSSRPSDTTSVTTAISSAPLAWAASAMGRRLRIRPNTSGLCTTTQAVSSSISAMMSSALPGVTGARCIGAEQAGHGFHRLGIMRMQAARQDRLAALGDALGHQHRFGRGGRAVIERGVGHFHAGQQRHLGLEFEQILQRALRDFRLIGRVAGEEFRALDQMIHRAGHMMLVGARAAEKRRRARRDVLRRQLGQRALDFQLALRVRQIEGRQRRQRRLGTSRNSASMSGAPILASMARRSSGVSGR